jgi:hypothetical protein
MIISHTHKFILIKSIKTAGTSVEAALSNSCSGSDVVTPLNDFPFNRDEKGIAIHRAMNAETLSWWDREIGQHVDAPTLQSKLSEEVWSSYFKFSIARNPWDRMVSLFTWSTRNDPAMKPRPRFYHRLGVPFDEIGEIRRHFSQFLCGEWETNDRFYIIDGELAVDFIVRYEDLAGGLDAVRRKIGLPEMTLPRLKTGIRPGHYHYSQYYDEQTKTLVATRHANDIRLFGYKFENA